jgi:hypothetical protein
MSPVLGQPMDSQITSPDNTRVYDFAQINVRFHTNGFLISSAFAPVL